MLNRRVNPLAILKPGCAGLWECRGAWISDALRWFTASDLPRGRLWATLKPLKGVTRRVLGTAPIFCHGKNIGVATMARPAPKQFDPGNIKTGSEYAKEALKDAKHAAKSGRGQINREEDLGDSTGAARHTITKTVPDK